MRTRMCCIKRDCDTNCVIMQRCHRVKFCVISRLRTFPLSSLPPPPDESGQSTYFRRRGLATLHSLKFGESTGAYTGRFGQSTYGLSGCIQIARRALVNDPQIARKRMPSQSCHVADKLRNILSGAEQLVPAEHICGDQLPGGLQVGITGIKY